jgi:hypothetical protein
MDPPSHEATARQARISTNALPCLTTGTEDAALIGTQRDGTEAEFMTRSETRFHFESS